MKTVQRIQNTINKSTHITKTPTHYKPTHTHTHTLQINAHISILQNPHTPTHYKNHIHTPTHYKHTHTQTHTLQNHTYTHPYIANSTHTHTHTFQNQLMPPQHQINTKWNNHNTIKYPVWKVTLVCMVEARKFNFLHSFRDNLTVPCTRVNNLELFSIVIILCILLSAFII
jgi:hypothetical protein